MPQYFLYDMDTGVHTRTMATINEAAVAANLTDNESWVEAPVNATGESHYVESGALVAKTVQTLTVDRSTIAADGIAEATISGIAQGSHVKVDDTVAEIIGTTVDFSTDTVGVHTLLFTNDHYLDTEVQIEATAP